MTLAGSSAAIAAGTTAQPTHRYLIERTFPAGALDGVDAAAKQKVNANNKTLDVNWEKSYANADKTKTYCVYTGPSEAAVREAAKLSGTAGRRGHRDSRPTSRPEPRGAVQTDLGGQSPLPGQA